MTNCSVCGEDFSNCGMYPDNERCFSCYNSKRRERQCNHPVIELVGDWEYECQFCPLKFKATVTNLPLTKKQKEWSEAFQGYLKQAKGYKIES